MEKQGGLKPGQIVTRSVDMKIVLNGTVPAGEVAERQPKNCVQQKCCYLELTNDFTKEQFKF